MKKPDCKSCELMKANQENKGLFNIFVDCDICDKMKKYEAFKESKRLYCKGAVITRLDTLLLQDFVMFHGRTKHIEVIKSMSLRVVLSYLKNNAFCYAINKKDLPF